MKKNYVKYALDAVLAIVFVLLLNKRVLGGLEFHEIAGLVLGAGLLIHVLLNWKWVAGVAAKLFNRKLPFKTRIGFALNLLLLVCLATIVVTGVLISKVLFPGIHSLIGGYGLQHIHTAVSYISLILIGIHVGLHWSWITSMTKKFLPIPMKGIAVRATAILIVAGICCLGMYNIVDSNYLAKMNFASSGSHGSHDFSQNEVDAITGLDTEASTEVQTLPAVQTIASADEVAQITVGYSGHGGGDFHGAPVSALSVLVQYLSIMILVAVMTRLLELLILSFRRPILQQA